MLVLLWLPFFSLQWRKGVRAETDINGIAEVQVPLSDPLIPMFEVVYVYPPHSLWSTYETMVPTVDRTFVLDPLPQVQGYEWWAEVLGVNKAHLAGYKGQGVRVAVIDTGIGPHPDLSNIKSGRNFTSDKGLESYEDVDGHGTHVAGIIGASGELIGIAPSAEIYAARVFNKGSENASSDDVAEAIEEAVEEWECNIINLSIGGVYDPLIEDRINYATQRGVLCIAAAGNSGGAVEYPAALRNSFSVAALGCINNTYPNNSIHRESEPESRGLYGKDNLYAAKFTCYGDEVSACAPGVAVISTVANQFYAALDGTSMACPMATGVAAILLSQNDSLLDIQPHVRVGRLKAQVRNMLKDIRLPRKFQGRGIMSL